MTDLKSAFANYLILSYAYYKLNKSLVSDGQFDLLCKTLLDNFDSFEHKYKHLVTKDDLEAGTGFAIQYPTELEHALTIAVKNWESK